MPAAGSAGRSTTRTDRSPAKRGPTSGSTIGTVSSHNPPARARTSAPCTSYVDQPNSILRLYPPGQILVLSSDDQPIVLLLSGRSSAASLSGCLSSLGRCCI